MSFSDTIKRTWNDNQLFSALVELTYACNWDCVFCYNDLGLQGEPLSYSQYQAFVDELETLGALQLTLTGGEPLAHPRFFDIGAYTRKRGFMLRIKSNGHAIDSRVAKRIRDELDPYLIELSIHGANAQTHDRQTRVPGSFERLLKHIEGMREAGLRIKLNSVFTKWNEAELDELLALLDKLDVEFQIDPDVQPRDNGDAETLELSASREGLLLLQERLRERARKRAAQNPSPHNDSKTIQEQKPEVDAQKHCGAGASSIALDPVGNVLPCVQWRRPIGNLHAQSLTEIWQGSQVLDEIRDTTTAAKEMVASYGEAGAHMRFCPGAAHTHHGNPLALYPAAKARVELRTREKLHLKIV